MRFKRQRRGSPLPEVNLVPMLDVLMVVLTFFIIVSMTLTFQQGVEIQLPSNAASPSPQAEPNFVVVRLDAEGQLSFDEQPITEAELPAQLEAFLETQPESYVILQADDELPYSQVVDLLGKLKDLGGDRVSLAIE